MTTAYPLAWPEGWPRTEPHRIVDGRRQFRRMTYSSLSGPYWTFPAARDALLNELRLLGAQHVVISSNFRTDRHGVPVEGSRRPLDQGIAIYFLLDGQPQTMAHDVFIRAEENMRALAQVIEAMRTIERRGGLTMMKRAFQGFAALPAPGRKPWWEVLGVTPTATATEIRNAWRVKATVAHPDTGGTDSWMAEINAARDEGLRGR